jgi:hypothetical protein
LAYASISWASQSVAVLVRRRWALLIHATRPTTATIAIAIQTQSHADPELLLAVEDVAVAPGVTDGWAGTTAPDEVLVGRAVLAAVDVAAGGDEGGELRPAVRLEAMLPTADDTLLVEPHAATSQVITTIRLAKTAHFFLTLAPYRAPPK